MPHNSTTGTDAALHQLNAEQRLAVETLDGPVLVVAGPGTGKTQLLSLRVVNILRNRDVNPENILCLTYTNAGVEALIQRLVGFIGRSAYAVRVATFHSFAESLYNDYPQYFERSVQDNAITALQSYTLAAQLLKQLPIFDPLYQAPFGGASRNLKPTLSFITTFKRSGTAPDDLRRILNQNLRACAYLCNQSEFLTLINTKMSLGKANKQAVVAQLEGVVAQAWRNADLDLLEPAVATPGIYLPFLELFCREFLSQPLFDDSTPQGSVARLNELKKRFFKPDARGRLLLKAQGESTQALSLLSIYERYQLTLAQRHQHDFDDMILDATQAICQHSELRHELKTIYRYILVDEFQDTNGVQMQLLDLVSGLEPGADSAQPLPNIMVVGDDDQAIMRFQGASVEYMRQFEEHYVPGAVKRVVLRVNYRSSPELVELASHVANQISNRASASDAEKRLVAAQGSQPLHLVAQNYPNHELQYYEVAKDIARRIDEGFLAQAPDPNTAIAVIAATHASLEGMISYLNYFGVPFDYARKSNIQELEPAQTLLACLRCVSALVRNQTAYAEQYLPQILVAPEFGIEPVRYLRFALAVRQSQKSWLEALLFCVRANENALESVSADASEQELLCAADTKLRALFSHLCTAVTKAQSMTLRGALMELAAPLLSYYNERAQSDPYSAMEFNYCLNALLEVAVDELEPSGTLRPAEPSDDLEPSGTLRPAEPSQSDDGAQTTADRSPRLTQLVELLDQAALYGVKLEITLPLVQSNAITLITAHSAKGLEFDLVYLLDASQGTWHSKESTSALLPPNLLFAAAKDVDDSRRLLYVALTRARNQLRVSCGGGELVGELLDRFQVTPVKPGVVDAAIQAKVEWLHRYYPAQPDLMRLFWPTLSRMRVSPTLLNSFVTYDKDDHDHHNFILSKVLRLPGPPSLALDFGNLAHEFLQDYINLVYKTPGNDAKSQVLATLLDRAKDRLRYLDFSAEDITHLEQRLDALATAFLPWLEALLARDEQGRGRDSKSAKKNIKLMTERWLKVDLDGVPLTGKSDLLLLDQDNRLITIYDFKTGKPGRQSPGYRRQLEFYKLMIESLPQYDGYRVAAGADLFVEPSRDNDWQIAPVAYTHLEPTESKQLRLLIQAVWARLQSGRFDTSAFEDSTELLDMKAGCARADGKPKAPSREQLQETFERWLINDYLRMLEKDESGKGVAGNE
ncbi:MAG: ATP-dependent helicase [Coriobacteriales bacterium]|jgi:DNA helicase-2/ATP-dependent DNA helicase PcrA|nr:ATP-dependent helicase [Coriobacteriales bacterium]